VSLGDGAPPDQRGWGSAAYSGRTLPAVSTRKKVGDLRTGDFVTWRASGAAAHGRIVSIHTAGTVPNVTTHVVGTEEDPAARLRVHDVTDDGWKPTDTHVAHALAALSKVDGARLAGAGDEEPVKTAPTRAAKAERRTTRHLHVRAVTPADGEPSQFWARVVTYNVLDDYRTKFRPACFADSLQARLPRLLYGHNGSGDLRHVLGFVVDDFDAVPSARQAWSQLQSGTLDQFSVGFWRGAETPDETDGSVWIESGDLTEVSLVLEGAVPGTHLISLGRAGQRSVAAVVPADKAAQVILDLQAGTIDLADALAALKAAAVEAPGDAGTLSAGEPPPDPLAGLSDEDRAYLDAISAAVTADADAATVAVQVSEWAEQVAAQEAAAEVTLLAEVDAILAGAD
jgi:phage head maturation protease